MPTRHGNYPIGFRQGGRPWHMQHVPAIIAWAAQNGFEAIDLHDPSDDDLRLLKSTGLKLGTVDLLEMGRLVDSEPGDRTALVARNVERIEKLAGRVKTFFTVIIGSKTHSRRENYHIAVETFGPLAEAAARAGSTIVIEGWPGPAPLYPGLCCTPETIRQLLVDIPSPGIGINFDPSHLVRLGVDPIRFVREFARHIYHVHAKDTQLLPDAIYEFGLYQPAAFTEPPAYGEQAWRYTIPGNGAVDWSTLLGLLRETGYDGIVSIELEDKDFFGTPEAEIEGLLKSQAFLRGF